MVTGLWSALKPYPRMKASGVEWLGAVPEHWELFRLGHLLKERGESNTDGQVSDILSLAKGRGVIPYAEKGNVGNKHSDDITRYKIVRPNDIVVNCMNVIIGSVGISKYTGCLSPVYYVLTRRSSEDNPEYLNAYFQTPTFQKSLVRIGNGILAHRMRIPMELLKCEIFPRPPLAEQNAIVKYLDYSQRRIRKLIQAKRKLIGLLNEQKQAIIHQAVTCGLDPDVPLKDSGIEWLGQIPAHWEVRRLKTICRMKSGENITSMSIDEIGNFPVYGGNGLRGFTSHFTHNGEYILIGRQGALCGNVHLVKGEFWASEHAVVVSPKCKYSTEWLALALMVMNLNQYSIAAAQPGISVERILNLWLALPPLQEQLKISNSIANLTFEIDQAIDRANREIELLNEYRARLIADVVTGKLDVREIAAALPETDPLANEDLNDPLEEENDLESADETEED
ncbi:MAG: restriction endonuclease subunit S [Cyanobacteriota bacterium]|jgi:type I restriction enzyme S subunit